MCGHARHRGLDAWDPSEGAWDEVVPQNSDRLAAGTVVTRAGERELDPGSTLVRTSWVCGLNGRNFVKTALRLAGERDELTVVDDQHGCPTFTPDLAEMIRLLVVARLPGTFHVTNQGSTSWFGFAREILAAAGLDPGRVRPIPTAGLDPPRPAPRPANSVLDNAALRLSGLPLLPDYHEPLERMVKELTR